MVYRLHVDSFVMSHSESCKVLQYFLYHSIFHQGEILRCNSGVRQFYNHNYLGYLTSAKGAYGLLINLKLDRSKSINRCGDCNPLRL